MDESLIYTDSRPRAKATGHAFGFEGNLGMGVIGAGMVSVFILTMLLETSPMPLLWDLAIASVPTLATTGYISLFRNKKPPRFDLDLLISYVNGPAFQPVRVQPRHPFFQSNDLSAP